MGEPLGRSDSTRAKEVATQGKGKTVLVPAIGELLQEKPQILGPCLKIAVQGEKIVHTDLTSRNFGDLHEAIRVARTHPCVIKARFLKNKGGYESPIKTSPLGIPRNEGIVLRQTVGEYGGLIRTEKPSGRKVFVVQNSLETRTPRLGVIVIDRGEQFRVFCSDRPAYPGRLRAGVCAVGANGHLGRNGGSTERLEWTWGGIVQEQWRVRPVCPRKGLNIRAQIGLRVPDASGRAALWDNDTGGNVASPFNEPLRERHTWGRGPDLEGAAKLPGKLTGQFVFKPTFPATVEKIGRCIVVHKHGEHTPFLDISDGWTRNVQNLNGRRNGQDWRGGWRPEHDAAEHAHERQDEDTETKAVILHTDRRDTLCSLRYCTARPSDMFDSLGLFTYRARVNTREKILDIAGRLFATQGYADTSLAQVARSAEVSKALILWHFNSKNDLFRTALQNFLSPYAIDATGLRGLSEREQFEKLIDDYYTFISDHLPSVKFVLGQVVREEANAKEVIDHVNDLYHVYQQLLTSILNQGRKTRVFMPDVQSAEEAALIMATLNGLLVQRLVDANGGIDAPRLLARFKETLWSRLSMPEAVPPLGRTAAYRPADGAHSAAER